MFASSETFLNSNKINKKYYVGRLLKPLLDALKWQGDAIAIEESLSETIENMEIDDFIDTMSNLNFSCRKMKYVDCLEISNLFLPLIVITSKSSYLVQSFNENDAFVFDAMDQNFKNMKKCDLSGMLYQFQYVDNLSETLIVPRQNWFTKLVTRFKRAFISLAVTTLFMTLLDLMLPLFMMLIYSQVNGANSLENLIVIGIGVLLYLIFTMILKRQRENILNYISVRMGHIITTQTMIRLMYLSPVYTETASINAQISRIKDFEGLKHFVTSGGLVSIFDLIFSILYIVGLFLFAGWIGMIPIITFILLFVLGLIMRPVYKVKSQAVSEANGNRQQDLMELLGGIETIRNLKVKQLWESRVNESTSAFIYNQFKLSAYNNLSNSISFFIINTSVLIVVYSSVIRVINGEMSTGLLIGLIMIYWKIIAAIKRSFSLFVQLESLQKSIRQINRFMNLPQDLDLKTSLVPKLKVKGSIRFMDVSLKYTTNAQPALFKVNFSHEAGKISAITGHDGSGKTTIFKTIMGMYQPQVGRILLDGMNIKQMSPLSLRRSISYSPDKDFMLTGTIRDNFKSVNAIIKDDEILEIIKMTGFDEMLEMEKYSLDTELDTNALSGLTPTFKKLLSISRTFARTATIYLFDEPENHLTPNLKVKVWKAIRQLVDERGASIIIATNDEILLNKCDHIISLNEGRVC